MMCLAGYMQYLKSLNTTYEIVTITHHISQWKKWDLGSASTSLKASQ